jgi:hypothetical protein
MRKKFYFGSLLVAAICGTSVALSQVSAQNGPDTAPGEPAALTPVGGGIVVQTGPDRPNAYYAPMMIGRSPGSSREGELNVKVQEALNKYTAAKDDDARQAARKQIQGALTDLFDVRQKEREEEIKQIEERVAKLRETLKKRESMRQDLIEHHLTTLIQDAEGLGWGSEGGISAGGMVRGGYSLPGTRSNFIYRAEPGVGQPMAAPPPVPRNR